MSLPEKIYPVEYAGFWEFSPDGMYGPSFLHGDDYPNAEQIANEMAKRYNNFPEILNALKGLTLYFEFMIKDPDFHEYKEAIEAIKKAQP